MQLFPMEPQLRDNLKFVFILFILFSTGKSVCVSYSDWIRMLNNFVTLKGKPNMKPSFIVVCLLLSPSASSENDWDLNFCGTWRHGKGSLSLTVDISTGCNGISISANRSSLSIDGQITAHCRHSDVIHLTKQFGLDSAEESNFCLYWEPLLDQLTLQVNQKKEEGGKRRICWVCFHAVGRHLLHLKAIITSPVIFHQSSGSITWKYGEEKCIFHLFKAGSVWKLMGL